MFASLIAFDGITFVNEPFGSDKLGEGDELLLDLGLNSGLKYSIYSNILLLNIDKRVAGPKIYSKFFVKIGG